MVCVSFLAATLVCGCATGPKGPTDQELVTSTITGLKDAVLAKDLEKIMACLAEDFYHPEVGDKAAMKDLAAQGLDMIDMSTAEVDLANMEVKVEGDTATAYPVVASASLGSVTVSLSLKKEKDGVWRITTGEAEGI